MATSNHCCYFIARSYFESMLDAVESPKYRQVLLDAILFNSTKIAPGSNWAFIALRYWMNRARNPANPYNGKKTSNVAEDLAPIWREDWSGNKYSYPETVWEEPGIIQRTKALFSYFQLEDYEYSLPPLPDEP